LATWRHRYPGESPGESTETTTELKSQTYNEKSKEVGIETLARRRYILDMAQTFKLVKGMDRVDPKVQERDGERTQADRDGTNLREKH
jgi:hypothetical protein